MPKSVNKFDLLSITLTYCTTLPVMTMEGISYQWSIKMMCNPKCWFIIRTYWIAIQCIKHSMLPYFLIQFLPVFFRTVYTVRHTPYIIMFSILFFIFFIQYGNRRRIPAAFFNLFVLLPYWLKLVKAIDRPCWMGSVAKKEDNVKNIYVTLKTCAADKVLLWSF